METNLEYKIRSPMSWIFILAVTEFVKYYDVKNYMPWNHARMYLMGLLLLLLTVFFYLTAPFPKLSRWSHVHQCLRITEADFSHVRCLSPNQHWLKHWRNSKNQPGNIVHCPFTFLSCHKAVTQQTVKTTLYATLQHQQQVCNAQLTGLVTIIIW